MYNKTNWAKTLKDPSEFESNWDWTVDHSEYHFDDNIKDKEGEWFKVLGRFDNPTLWQEDTDRLIKESSKAINWETRKYSYSNEISPMLKQEEYDIAQGGGDPKKLMLTNMTDKLENYPMLIKMKDHFGILGETGVNFKFRSHVQLPGQMFNLHIDKLWDICKEDPEQVCRITFFLEDWKPGQFYMYGNYIYERWKAGEAHIFDWPNVPHTTANASNSERPVIQITGLKSDKTREIIENGSKDVIWKI